MTEFYLIRHAAHDLLGRELVGRRPGVRLSDRGRRQAAALALRLAAIKLDAVLSSPRERACETAAPIAARQNLEVEVVAALDEVDFGEWTGRSFAELEANPSWSQFNRARSRAAIPAGESLLSVQLRMMELIERLAGRHPKGAFALVSHGDVIRAMLLHYLGVSLDHTQRLHIAPASVSVLRVDAENVVLRGLNAMIEE